MAATYPSSRRRVEGNLDALREVGIDTQAVPVFETLSDEATVHAALEEISRRRRRRPRSSRSRTGSR